MLPDGWCWQPLLELVDSSRGICYGIVQPGNHDPDGVPMVNSGDIFNGRVVPDVSFRVAVELHKKYKRSTLYGGEVLVTLVGANFGQVAIAPTRYAGHNCARPVGIVPVLESNRFVMYALQSPLLRQRMDNVANTTAQPTLNLKDLGRLPIPIPPTKIRAEIADLLGAFDDRITLLRDTNTTLETISQALFKSWFVDFDPVRAKMEGHAPEGMDDGTAAMFPDGFEDTNLGRVPRGWSHSTLGQLANVIDCLHSKKPSLVAEGRPFLQLNNIRDDGLLDTSSLANISDADYLKWTSRIEVAGGDCVITNVGRVGAIAQIPEGFCAAMGRNMTAIRPRQEWPYPTFLIELLQSPWMRAEIVSKTDAGTILNALNVKSIPRLRCIVGSHPVLQHFEQTTRPLRASMEANLAKAHTLATTRDTLLPRLVSGQLRLPDVQSLMEAALA